MPVPRWIRLGLVVLTAGPLAGCGDATPPQLFRGQPLSYVLTIDQLRDAGFAIVEGPASIGAGELGGDTRAGTALTSFGLEAAARVRYFRTVSDVATSNGPLDVTAAVARYRDAAGASRAMALGIRTTDNRAGETPVSPGPLGDEAHADQVSVKDASGTTLTQLTVTWRLGNLVNVVVARGRYGGARITDAVTLANAQINNELGVITFAPPPVTSSPTSGQPGS